MNRIIAWFVHNSVAANLLMFELVAGGLLTLPSIHQEEFPSIDTDLVRVSVEYRGAAPEEVEQGICVRIEEEIEGTPGVDRISSIAVEGNCVVTIELVTGADSATTTDEIKNRIDAITTFPLEAETPIISNVILTNRVIQLALTGDAGAVILSTQVAELPSLTRRVDTVLRLRRGRQRYILFIGGRG